VTLPDFSCTLFVDVAATSTADQADTTMQEQEQEQEQENDTLDGSHGIFCQRQHQ
jgi:hypothetical protein